MSTLNVRLKIVQYRLQTIIMARLLHLLHLTKISWQIDILVLLSIL